MKRIDWAQLSALGLVERMNREILHPLGLAVCYEPDSGKSTGALVAPDGKFEYADTTLMPTDEQIKERIKVMIAVEKL